MPATRSEDAAAASGDAGGYDEDTALPPAADRVQSNVLRSMNPQAALYIFFRIVNRRRFRRLVRVLVDPPQNADDDDPDPIKAFLSQPPDKRRIWPEAQSHTFDDKDRRTPRPYTWTLAFTWTGLDALGIHASTLDSFPEEFRDGMAARAARLGDVGASGPETWDAWFGHRRTHGVLSIMLQPVALEPVDIKPAGDTAPEGSTMDPRLRTFQGVDVIRYLTQAFDAYGFAPLHLEIGTKITHPGQVDGDYRIEHFGFRDGLSQPFADARLPGPPSSAAQVQPVPPPPGGGTARPGGTWDPIALGELLLGRPDEDGIRQPWPASKLLRDDGTYMVFRKLEQDVVGFRRYLARHDGTAGRESRLAAQMVGRWPNGTSLVRAPDFPADELATRAVNDFRYQDEDPRGRRCPIGAHARRLNPRDSNNRDEARRHRIWRRSITYGGPFLPYGAADDGRKRGLLFIALCARIDQQFEFLQTRWLNGGEFSGHAGIARCPLTGANGGDLQDSFAAPGRPAPYTHLPRFVTTRGGDYFFMPSIPALKAIAGGERFESPSGRAESSYGGGGKSEETPDVVEPLPTSARPGWGDFFFLPMTPDTNAIASVERVAEVLRAAGDDNPGIDETPKVIDPEALSELGRRELLPNGETVRPGWIERNGIVLVGRHSLVRRVLESDAAFRASGQDARIRRMTGGEGLMLGLSSDDPEHGRRARIWHAARAKYRGPPPDAIVAQAMQAVLARHGPAGRLDVVRDVSLGVPMVLARHYFGVKGPEFASPSYIASLFNKLDISQVPRDWLAVLPHVPPQDVPIVTLAAWSQIAFAQVFVNVVNAGDLAALAERTTGEFLRHLDKLIAEAVPHTSTLLGCLLSLRPEDFGLDGVRLRTIARLLLIETTVASAGTLAEALPSVLNYLLDHPDDLEMAREALAKAAQDAKDARDAAMAVDAVLDAVIREALRFDPVGPILFRRCVAGTELRIPVDSTVAALLKTAMFDPDVFRDPDKFCIDAGRRPPEDYLHFGHGPHACIGKGIATGVLREMFRAIIGLKDLRRAAGPLGNQFDSLGRYQSLVVRFTP